MTAVWSKSPLMSPRPTDALSATLGARKARITLERSEDRMVVTVEDDGRGFEPRQSTDVGGRGLGLVGMAERARFLGGRFGIESANGEGTRVIVEVPGALGERRR